MKALQKKTTLTILYDTLTDKGSEKILSEGLRFYPESFFEKRVSQEFLVRLRVPLTTIFLPLLEKEFFKNC